MTAQTSSPRLVFLLSSPLLSSAPPPSTAMVLPSSSPPAIYHPAAPFPAATTFPRPSRRGSLRLAAPVRCHGPSVGRRRCDCFDLHRQIVPYAEFRARQKSVVARRKGLLDRDEDFSDTLIALQHPPTYTLGTGGSVDNLHFSVEGPPFETHRVDRGGEVTYHGPGQLVMYPILNLRYHIADLHWYLRPLEEVVIRALKSSFSIKVSRDDKFPGVWVGDRKVAAVGIHASRGISYHGLALNITTDLTPFEMIVPCGIKDRGVVSIKEILQKASDGREMDDASLTDRAYNALIEEFAEFFNLALECRPDWTLQEKQFESSGQCLV